MRRASWALPSWASSSATLLAAPSVRAIGLSTVSVVLTGNCLLATVRMASLPGDQVDLTRIAVGQRAEPLDVNAPEHLHHSLDDAPVQVADQLGEGLGQLAVRAVGEGDGGGAA